MTTDEQIVDELLKHQELTHHSGDMFVCQCGEGVLQQTNFDFDAHVWHQAEAIKAAIAEDRPSYVLELRAQALDRVQELIAPGDDKWVGPPLPTQEQWEAIVDAAFPPPPMAGGVR